MQRESLICMHVNVFMFYNNIFPDMEIAYLGFYQEYIYILKRLSFIYFLFLFHS